MCADLPPLSDLVVIGRRGSSRRLLSDSIKLSNYIQSLRQESAGRKPKIYFIWFASVKLCCILWIVKDKSITGTKTMSTSERTQIILARVKGNVNEWTKLHAILCITHGWLNADSIEFRKWIDLSLIADRMDEIYKSE